MMLTQQEREKFVTYLDGEAAGIERLLPEMEKLPGMGPVKTLFKMKIAAFRLVANELRSAESVTLKTP